MNSTARLVLTTALSTLLCFVLLPSTPATAATDHASFTRWTSTADLAKGSSKALTVGNGSVTIARSAPTYRYDDPRVSGGARTYDYGVWQSPWVTTGFGTKAVLPSWNISAPGGTWARVDVRVGTGSSAGSWDSVARWALGSSSIVRSSYGSQSDDLAKLVTDTVVAKTGTTFKSWQIRVVLFRPTGTTTSPTLHAVSGASSSYLTRAPTTSTTTVKSGLELAVPRYSQMIHRGEFPQWGGGGEAWCSPTSTSMVMRYFNAGPTAKDYSFSPYAESWVDHAARFTYDQEYRGTGNWPFNTAYAAHYSLDSFVTRLANLRDAEAFIRAGIPVVASVAYGKGQLTGSPISSTPGHLLVIVGFTKTGQVVTNDPAAPKGSTVRRVYYRAQFEKAWLGGSGGVSYIIRPTSRALPPDTVRW